jgi:hypothetical protein
MSPLRQALLAILYVSLSRSQAQLTTGRQEGIKEILLYDTSDADAVQFQCDPLDDTSQFNPRCNLDPTTCDTWICRGSASLTYCDSEFFVPGRTSDIYQMFNCTDDNVAACDSACSCITGTYSGSGSSLLFNPDGGNCTILDVDEGSLAPYPTDAPSIAPKNATPTDAPSASDPLTPQPSTLSPLTTAPSESSTQGSTTTSPSMPQPTSPPTISAADPASQLYITRFGLALSIAGILL